ncbi:sirohydrochlorin chelatase [Streptomyces nitrosporeus]
MSGRCRLVAVCGHEADGGEALRGLAGPETAVVTGGRELIRALAGLRRAGEKACVLPMTLGRDPELVADTARTLRALPAAQVSGTLLAEPFGTAQHLTAWLRAAAGRVPASAALLVTAPTAGPFDDAELYRIAHLVRSHGRHELVEVALTGGAPGLAEGVRRCGLLGAPEVAVLPAAFHLPHLPGAPGTEVTCAGPLLSRAALGRVMAERMADALRRWDEHGDDGIASGLTAADDHGHSHTHPPGEDHHHGHGRPAATGHGHTHAAHGHTHAAHGENGHTHVAHGENGHTHAAHGENGHTHAAHGEHDHDPASAHTHPQVRRADRAIRSTV